VHAGRLGGDEQLGGDLPVALAARDQRQHLALPVGQCGDQAGYPSVPPGLIGPVSLGALSQPRPAAQVVQRGAQRGRTELVSRRGGGLPRALGLRPRCLIA
jgi:hypothetical protein